LILQNNNLFSLNLNKELNLLSPKIIDFTAISDGLYYLPQDNSKNVLQKSDFNFKNNQDILDLSNTDYQILSQNSSIFLKNLNGDFYYLSSNKLIKLNENEKLINWSENSILFGLIKKTEFIYTTNLDDIYFFDPETGENGLVYRTVEPIKKISWYSDLNHIVFNTDSAIKIIDLDGKNEISLLKGKDFDMVAKDKIIYLDQDNKLKIAQVKE